MVGPEAHIALRPQNATNQRHHSSGGKLSVAPASANQTPEKI
jgi:hypothetical protein